MSQGASPCYLVSLSLVFVGKCQQRFHITKCKYSVTELQWIFKVSGLPTQDL